MCFVEILNSWANFNFLDGMNFSKNPFFTRNWSFDLNLLPRDGIQDQSRHFYLDLLEFYVAIKRIYDLHSMMKISFSLENGCFHIVEIFENFWKFSVFYIRRSALPSRVI